MPAKQRRRIASWSLYPGLHDRVTELLEQDDLFFGFHAEDDAANCIKDKDTNIMGRFTCKNKACLKGGWSSKTIAVTIRMYPGAEYNARVYHQRCMDCNRLSKPVLDDSYAERIANRIRIWSGMPVEFNRNTKKSKGPHQSELCEGCKHGHCMWAGH